MIPVLYQNDEILIVNKPAGVPVQGGAGISRSLDTELPRQLGFPVYLVHRLDKETAGIMVVAKSPRAAHVWTALIAGKQVRKEYEAVCIGIPRGGMKGTVSDRVVQGGVEKDALTHYEVLRTTEVHTAEGTCTLSWLRLRLATGRMHQIRIHLAGAGCPVAGDDKHGDFKQNKLLRKECGIKRLMLASVQLTVPGAHADGGADRVFTIPLPAHMESCRKLFEPAAVTPDRRKL